MLVVIDPPRFDVCLGMLDRRELGDVQTLVTSAEARLACESLRLDQRDLAQFDDQSLVIRNRRAFVR